MRKTVFLAAALALCAPALASAETTYGVTPDACLPTSSEGFITIGDGQFRTTDGTQIRVSEKRDAGNGFFEAEYDISAEGESMGIETIKMRITDAAVDVLYEDGRSYTAKRCR